MAIAAAASWPWPEALSVELLLDAVEAGSGRYCVSLEGEDPSASLLASANGSFRLFLPASACHRVGTAEDWRVVEVVEDVPAIELNLRLQRQGEVVSTEPMVVMVGLTDGPFLGHGHYVEVERRSTGWHWQRRSGFWIE